MKFSDMQDNKHHIEAARKVYEAYLDSDIKGGLETFASTLDERDEMIVTLETSYCHSKADGSHVLADGQKNNTGIHDDIKGNILQPFFTTKKAAEVRGPGLSITHDIVKTHGGELRMETIAGEGSAFIIAIPSGYESVK